MVIDFKPRNHANKLYRGKYKGVAKKANTKKRNLNSNQAQAKCLRNGFSMVEVLIAGTLLAAALAAVSRMSVAALSGSAHQSERMKIEAAINDNIQALQKEDSYYTDEWIIQEEGGEEGFENACLDPPEALRKHLIAVAPKPRQEAITRTFDSSSIPGILRITFNFTGPEQQVKEEQRIIEMTPNFAANCFKTQ